MPVLFVPDSVPEGYILQQVTECFRKFLPKDITTFNSLVKALRFFTWNTLCSIIEPGTGYFLPDVFQLRLFQKSTSRFSQVTAAA